MYLSALLKPQTLLSLVNTRGISRTRGKCLMKQGSLTHFVESSYTRCNAMQCSATVESPCPFTLTSDSTLTLTPKNYLIPSHSKNKTYELVALKKTTVLTIYFVSSLTLTRRVFATFCWSYECKIAAASLPIGPT